MSTPCGGKAAHGQLGDAAGLVGRIVEHLDFEQFARIVDARRPPRSAGPRRTSRCRAAAGWSRPAAAMSWAGLRLPVPVLHVQVHEVVPVPAVDRENDEDEEVRSERKSFSGRHLATIDYISDELDPGNKTTAFDPCTDECVPAENAARRVAGGHLTPATPSARLLDALRARALRGSGFRPRRSSSRVRQGFPEVVLGLGKTPAQIAAIAGDRRARVQRCSSPAPTESLRRRPRTSCPAPITLEAAGAIALRQAGHRTREGHDPGRRGGHLRPAGRRGSRRARPS